jgi:DNA (cytosine-5)-methyltransferase 1
MPPRKCRDATAIDLFCGAGGLSFGLKETGFQVAFALDNDRVATKTYANNLGPHVLTAPIEEICAHDLLSRAGLAPGECTLLAGGPPCQGFSLQRRGERQDPRNRLILEFVRIVEGVRPSFFLIENVGGLLSKHGLPFLRELSLRTSRLNYIIHVATLDAVDFGVPQIRKRAFLVGEHAPQFSPRFKFPTEKQVWRTVRDAIGDLPSPPDDGTPHAALANHYREIRLAPINLERIRHIPPGGER